MRGRPCWITSRWGFGDGKSPQFHVAHLEQQVADLQSRIERLETATGTALGTPASDNRGEGI